MKITGKTIFHQNSEINGKKIKDMSTEERGIHQTMEGKTRG